MESKFGKKRKSISSSSESYNNNNNNINNITPSKPIFQIKTRSQSALEKQPVLSPPTTPEEDKHPKKKFKTTTPTKLTEPLQPIKPITPLSLRKRRLTTTTTTTTTTSPDNNNNKKMSTPSKDKSPSSSSDDIVMGESTSSTTSSISPQNSTTSTTTPTIPNSNTDLNNNNLDTRNTLQGLMRNLSGQLIDELSNSRGGIPTNGLINTLIEGRSRSKILLQGLKSDDESKQLEAVLELCELLSIATEDTIAGFPSDAFAPALINLLNMDHNPEMMLFAGRALSNMMEALPNSVASVINHGAIPMLCAKLLNMEYIDLAEQFLQTLEKISVEQPSAVLRSGGLMAVLSFLDFLSTGVQRMAVQIAANICKMVPPDCFEMVRDAVPILSNLLFYSDQKVVELSCLSFSRLVESFHDSIPKLEYISSEGLIPSLVRIISGMYNTTVSTLSPATYSQIIRIMASIAHTCPHLVLVLIQEGIVPILHTIMSPNQQDTSGTGVVNRTNQQCYEILSLINELLPPLPVDYSNLIGPLKIGHTVLQSSSSSSSRVIRKTKDSFDNNNNNNNTTTTTTTTTTTPTEDPRTVIYRENPKYLLSLGRDLFVVLVEMFTSTLVPQVRYKCLGSICKILHFSSSEMVSELLKDFAFSSFLASLLGSRDMNIVSTALKIAEMMMDKLPSIFDRYFKREGVLYEIDRISKLDLIDLSSNVTMTGGIGSSLSNAINSSSTTTTSPNNNSGNNISTSPTNVNSPSNITNSPTTTPISIPTTPNRGIPPPLASSPFGVGNFFGSPGGPIIPNTPTHSLPPSLTSSLNQIPIPSSSYSTTPTSTTTTTTSNAVVPSPVDELKSRTCREARKFKEKFFPKQLLINDLNDESFATKELLKLKNLSKKLNSCENEEGIDVLYEIRDMLVNQEGISAFEFLHSDLVASILSYLTRGNIKLHSECFAKVFLTTFKDHTVSLSSSLKSSSPNPLLLSLLIEKLHDALNKVERFNITTSDVQGTSSGLKYLAQPFKLRLSKEGDDETLKDFSGNVVLIEPLATVTAIEDYLLPKVLIKSTTPISTTSSTGGDLNKSNTSLPSSSPSSPSTSSSTAGDSTKQQSPSLKTTDDLKKKQELMDFDDDYQNDYEDDELLQDSDQNENETETVHDVKINESLSNSGTFANNLNISTGGNINNNNNTTTTTTSTSSTSSTTPTVTSGNSNKIALFVDNQRLPSNLTIFQAVQRLSKSTNSLLQQQVGAGESSTNEISISINRLWEGTHTLKYRYLTNAEVESPLQKHGSVDSKVPIKTLGSSRLLHFLKEESTFNISTNDSTYEILSLLRILNMFSIDPPASSSSSNFITQDRGLINPLELLSQKLTAKIMKQLQDPLSLCGGAVPEWCKQLLNNCSFLFPFDCKRLFFYSTSFGIARALLTLQQRQDSIRQSSVSGSSSGNNLNQNDGNRGEVRVGRIQRQKVRIARVKILESAIKVMDLYGKSKSILEVEYFGEAGTGLGPTLEFFTLVSREIQRKDLNLWYIDNKEVAQKDEDSSKTVVEDIYAYSIGGLFPLPVKPNTISKKVLDYFKFLGTFVAKTFFDQRLIDLPLSKSFYKYITEQNLDFDDLKQIAPAYARSLNSLYGLVVQMNVIKSNSKLDESQKSEEIKKLNISGAKVEDLCLDFVLPGYPDWELKENGSDISVTLENLEEYLNLIVKNFLYTGVHLQMEAFKEGFNLIFPVSSLKPFTIHEIESLLCGSLTGSDNDWSIDSLVDSTKADHGYTTSSTSVQNLFSIMSEFTLEQRKQFLLFISGSPHLPIQGFKGLIPRLTVVKKHHYPPLTPDDYLLSVMSCTNYIKLPDYSSKEVMKTKLLYAMKEGQASFDLS